MPSHKQLRHSRRVTIGIVAAGVLALVAGSATAGILSSLHVTKRTVAGKSMQIVVDRRGDTVYELSGESLAHLQCVTKQCLKTWPPVEVRSASARPPTGPGVPGKLSILRRVKANLFQVMLNRHPLYFYSGDTKIGFTRGQGVKGPGGTWHVVPAS